MNESPDQYLTLEDYFHLPYAVTLTPEEEGGFTVEISDLPGCVSQGESEAEALGNIYEAKQLWLETAFEAGDSIPLPGHMADHSGRLVVRFPKPVHRQLAEAADRNGVSLDNFVLSLLSKEAGASAVAAELQDEVRKLRESVERLERRSIDNA